MHCITVPILSKEDQKPNLNQEKKPEEAEFNLRKLPRSSLTEQLICCLLVSSFMLLSAMSLQCITLLYVLGSFLQNHYFYDDHF